MVEGKVDTDSEHLGDGGLIMGVSEDLGNGGPVDTSERGRTEEALWTEGVAAVTWVLGALGCGSGKAGGSERTGFDNFLCFDLGEG